MAPATRLGLRTAANGGGMLSTAARIPTYRPFSTSAQRHVKAPKSIRLPKAAQKGLGYSPTVQNAQNQQRLTSALINAIVPGTWVRPPWKQVLASNDNLFVYLKSFLWTKGSDIVQRIAFKFRSKPGFFKGAGWKIKRSEALTTAKALHRAMLEAVAAGDKAVLKNLCAEGLRTSLEANIDARVGRGVRYSWELVRYNQAWLYPRIVSDKIAPLALNASAPALRQVIVAINSRQRRVQHNIRTGEVVPGSEKEADLLEYFVIQRLYNQTTWEGDDWRIFGFIKPTSLQEHLDEMALMKNVEEGSLSKYKV